MQKKLILLFLIFFILTFVFTRVFAIFLHDFDSYDPKSPKDSGAKTITGLLRKLTGFDWHHIHIGVIFLGISVLIVLSSGLNEKSIIISAIGMSLFLDQVFPLMNLGNYFGFQMLMVSSLMHLIVIEISLIFLKTS